MSPFDATDREQLPNRIKEQQLAEYVMKDIFQLR